MARVARKTSESGVYHILLRGINNRAIFYDEEDGDVFLSRLEAIKTEEPYALYAVCLMGNHIHLLIKGGKDNVPRILMKLLSGYVHWYNHKHKRQGRLFQDRYKSDPIEADAVFLNTIRHIHQNPVKAGMVKTAEEYAWSSHNYYISEKKSFFDTDVALAMLGGVEGYQQFIREEADGEFLESTKNVTISDEKLMEQIEDICLRRRITDVLELKKEARTAFLKKLRQIPGTTLRQISRVTEIPMHIVRRIK